MSSLTSLDITPRDKDLNEDTVVLPQLDRKTGLETVRYALGPTLVKGDALVPAISAASIVAKVHRDRWCAQVHGNGFIESFRRHILNTVTVACTACIVDENIDSPMRSDDRINKGARLIGITNTTCTYGAPPRLSMVSIKASGSTRWNARCVIPVRSRTKALSS